MRIPFLSKKKKSDKPPKPQKPRSLSSAEASRKRQNDYIKRLNNAGKMKEE
jgi:hypothetical protein